ncbi:PKD domain-containing protein, partial [Intrasporangium oryzae]|uniref:PKD domain-containing protein n=1 Tax=Intrasporangium oryzae TaxID=412687 RepID=UPI0012F9CB7D
MHSARPRAAGAGSDHRAHPGLRLALCLVAVLLLALGARPAVSSAATGVDEVHYTFTGSSSVAIDWRGAANDVRWGTTTEYGQTATGVAPAWTPWSSSGPFWQLELGGLSAGATYHYSIGGGPDYTFHAPPTSTFRFDAIGDVGDTAHFSKLATTLDNISADDPSFVLMVGDLTYANGSSSNITAVDQHFNDVMRWSNRSAYMPAWGNHEYDVAGSDDLRNYKGRLLMPHAAASPGSPAISCCGNDWGWFDSGPVRFISYPEPWTGAWSDWQSKAGPLMRQAQDDPTIKYIVTYGHRPAYSTGYHAGEAQLASILGGFGDSYSKYVLNINGHSHDYERFQPIQGVTHVTVGAPSSLEQPWTSTDVRTALRTMHLSHLRVDVGDTGLRLQAICDQSTSGEDLTCSAGSVIDEYVIGTPPALPVATDFYVDRTSPTCSDSGTGSSDAPFCTLTKGVARLQAGNALYIGNGTYAETIKPSASGTASAPITITSWPGRSPVIGTGVTNGAYISAKSYITLANLTFTATTGDGIYVTKSDHITVTGNTVTNAGRQAQGATAPGISIRATNYAVVSDNDTNHNSDTGIYITNTSTGALVSDNQSSFNAQGWQRNANGINVTSPGNTVIRNVTHDNEDSGIQLYTGANNNLVTLNVTYNNGDHGIDNLNVTGGTIVGNTVFHNCTTGVNLEGSTSGSYRIGNNIAVDNAVYPAYAGIACARRAGNIGVWDGAQNTTLVDHNLVYLTKSGVMYAWGTTFTSLAAMQKASGQEASGVQADPKFVSPASWALQLKEGSPALDRADSGIPGEQATDILGYPRVRDPNVSNAFAAGPRLYDDLGAYEFQPEVLPAPIQPPTAALALTPTQGTAPLAVTADASASTDPQGQTLTYAFDFGDGTTLPAQSSPTATHTYQSAGTFTVTVTARNTSGVSGVASSSVTVTAPPPVVQPPSAALTVTPSNGIAPLSVTADASASTDPQGGTLAYAFDFGDGTVLPAQASATANHVYPSAGTFTVTVTVSSSTGLSSSTSATVTAANAPVVQPPAAALSVTPTGGTAPLAVTADAGASTDPQGQVLSYAFDFGDGTTLPAQAFPTATHTFTTAGAYTVTVTVTNTSGLSDSAASTLAVSDPPVIQAPAAALSVTPVSGTAPLAVTADAGASSDPQGQTLTYAFDFGDGTTVPAQASPTATHTYATAGAYTVSATVTNTSGLSATAQQTVTASVPVLAPVASLGVSPSAGLTPLAVTADAGASSDPQGQALTYAFDFGDGTTLPAQASPTATHSY